MQDLNIDLYSVIFTRKELEIAWAALNEFRKIHSDDEENIATINQSFGAVNYMLTGEGYEIYGNRGGNVGDVVIAGRRPQKKVSRIENDNPDDVA